MTKNAERITGLLHECRDPNLLTADKIGELTAALGASTPEEIACGTLAYIAGLLVVARGALLVEITRQAAEVQAAAQPDGRVIQ